MKLLYTIALLFCTLFCKAQTEDIIDSLEKVIKSNAAYTEKIKAYILLTEQLNFSNPTATITVAQKAIDLAAKKNDSVSIALIIRNKGLAYSSTGKRDTGILHYLQAANIFERHNAKSEQASVYNLIARMHRKNQEHEKALFYYDMAMKIYENLKDKDGIATINNESGVVYEYMGNYDEAIRRYKASLAYRKESKDSIGLAYSLSFLGGSYFYKNETALSESYHKQALAIRERIKDSFALAYNYADLGYLYKQLKRYPESVKNYNKAIEIGKANNILDILKSCYEDVADVYSATGNYKMAYESNELHNKIKDSLFGIEKAKQIQLLSTQYETAKKEQRIAEQELQISKRNYWIAGISGLLILLSLLGYSYYKRYKLKQQSKLQQEVLKQQELATKAVLEAEENERKRIAAELHDGVGQMMSAAKMNLSAMENEIAFNNESQKTAYEKALSLVDESCKEVRTVSHNMMPNALIKAGLASAVRDFIDKIDDRVIKVDLYTEGLKERIDSNTETVLYRVIQECVNNTIKHAKANHLDISIIKDNEGISITIEDNGKGFNTSDTSKFEGIGLKNILSRINYLKGEIEWNSAPGKGTLVSIHIPA